MTRRATTITLSAEDEQTLREWVGSAARQQRIGERAMIVLLAAEGHTTQQIARVLGTRPARVSKWRTRFAVQGSEGLRTGDRPGKPPTYDDTVDSRILSLVEETPPDPHRVWTGALLAQALGNVSIDHVWRVLRAHGISLRKRDARDYWTRSTVVVKGLSLIGLYLNRETSAFLIGTAHAAAISHEDRLRTYFRFPNLDTASGSGPSSPGSPSLTLLGAVKWAASLAAAGLYAGTGARTYDDFLSDALAHRGPREIDTFIVGPRQRTPPRVQTHVVPTFDAWKEQLGPWLALCVAEPAESSDWTQQLLSAATEFVGAQRVAHAQPFEWHASWAAAHAAMRPGAAA